MSVGKSIERWNKRIWYGLFRLIFRVQPAQLPLALNKQTKVLVFRYDRVGDMVVTLPALQFLASRGAQVHVLGGVANLQVLDDAKLIERGIILPRNALGFLRTILQLRSQDYDLILCMVFHRSTNAGLLANIISRRAVKVGRLYSSRRELYSRLFNVQLDIQTPRDRMTELLVHFCSSLEHEPGDPAATYNPEDFCYELSLRKERRDSARQLFVSMEIYRPILINISAGGVERNFTTEICTRLLRQIHRVLPGCPVVLLSMERDKELAAQIAGELGKGIQVLPAPSHVLDSAAIIEKCALVVTPDTAIVHIADSLAIPVIGIYLDPSENWMPSKASFAALSCTDKHLIASFSDQDLSQALSRLQAEVLGRRES